MSGSGSPLSGNPENLPPAGSPGEEKQAGSPAPNAAARPEGASGGVHLGKNVYTDPVYYYSRERRLSRASPAVQALNDGKQVRPSLSRTLFATRAHVMIFVTIIILCAMFVMASRTAGRENGMKLGGNTVALVIFSEDRGLILGIAKSMPSSGGVYTGPVDVAVSPVMPKPAAGEPPAQPRVFTHRVFFMPVESESYRIPIPFTDSDFLVLLSTGTEQKSVRIKTSPSPEK